MYYLWKDKKSTKNTLQVYITDYKEINKQGNVKIDGYGYLDVELIFSSPVKADCIIHAQKLML